MEVNRSNMYYKPLGESAENLSIMRLMDEHCLGNPTEGVLQVQDYLDRKSTRLNSSHSAKYLVCRLLLEKNFF